MSEERARQLLKNAGAVLTGHFVGNSGKHFSVYVAKDRATQRTSVISELCASAAELFEGDNVEVVVSPAVGGIALAQWTAYHLTCLHPDRLEVLALYVEHDEEVIIKCGLDGESNAFEVPSQGVFDLLPGEKLVVVKPGFVLKRGFAADVKGKRILVAEDILTTGGSAARTVEAVKNAGGIVVGCAVLANGGKVTATDIGVPRLEALVTVERQLFTKEECADHGLCAQDVPVNTDFGHGAEFLAQRQ